MTMTFNAADLVALGPLLLVVAVACVLLVAETFVKGHTRHGLSWVGIVGAGLALVGVMMQWEEAAAPRSLLGGVVVLDRMALLLDAAFLVTAIVTLLLSAPYLREHGIEFGEFYPLVLLTTSGMMMVAHASHMLMLLIGIETMSLGAYVLTGCWRRSPRSTEGAMKYFLMGAFATGFLLYGIALVYGTAGGAFAYADIAAQLGTASQSTMFHIGLYLIVAALLFKVGSVPFHMWTPDAYEGAPTVVTGFMAAGVKAAAFGAFIRLATEAFADKALVPDGTGWVGLVSLAAVATMILGNVAAVRQENVKRLLAYSSIAHAGYLLVGVAALGMGIESAKPALLFYLVAYTFTTLGSFGVAAWVGRRGDERLYVDDWAGLGQERPGLALAMTVFLLSLGGVPPTVGFVGKFYLFRAAVEQPRLIPLVVVGVLTSAISVFYYLRLVVAMYFRDPVKARVPLNSGGMRVAIVVTALAVLAWGLFPQNLVELAGAPAVKAAVTAVLGR